ncbi:hypothetical protein ACSCB1_24220 [Streptomyces europaeiscabiei]|uniref:Integral membrane protein n=1 Tax=Streptomyces europaeiscabiei TaxID=146819 RepID=A0ABU4NA01_9ACTN|nr:hypothetical protein [Streptomyces europaeiscabiei]MDX2524082.1 hypothetical protein [Streptomyces europaeiscabiei]MDX2765859.1 hypothetical protein [Streptomyces europaeiscabiei]MDX2768986.1 hypothetical protein [Streptomyces europaeiscabiei]MDX3545361.1 hypothetical protein [Streptomyces europaeiscabiei]MDX3554352.1 hypothetical protein [Streptomyces europaeiscabiei]
MRSAHRIVRSLVRHELLLLGSVLRWIARRPHGLGEGGRAFGYARGQGAMMFGFGFVCVVETVTMSVLLHGFPLVHQVFLVLDLYTILIVVGLHAASVTRPHVLAGTTLRLRRFATVDLCVPLTAVASVRRELRTTHDKRDGELNMEVGSQTTVTVELDEPVAYLTFFGRRREVRLVRFHADESDQLVRLLREFTPERTAPSPLPVPPA